MPSTTRSNRARPVRDDYLSLVKRFPLVPIRDDAHLRAAHRVIDELSIIDEGKLSQGEADYLDVLSDLTLKYEESHRAIDLAKIGATEVLEHLLRENDMSAGDLGRLLGQRELGGKILRRERSLSKAHIQILADRFNVEPGLFF